MARTTTFAIAAIGAALAFGVPVAASAHDWDNHSTFSIGFGFGNGYYAQQPAYGYYDNRYERYDNGYDRRAAWIAHERWEHKQHERAEARQRYWEQRRYYEGGYDNNGYGHRRHHHDDDDD